MYRAAAKIASVIYEASDDRFLNQTKALHVEINLLHVYNRTPHKSNDMTSPIQVFNPNHRVDITQLKRFGCLAYMKLQRKTVPKFKFI